MRPEIAHNTADESRWGVELDAVAAWMDRQSLEAGPLCHVGELTGGTQNVMLRFSRGGREFILRRGPIHLRPHSNEALRREVRLLSALRATDVPHPQLIAACMDEAVLDGAVFYLMEPVDGCNVATELSPVHAKAPQVRHRMGLSMIDALVALGTVDYEAVGLRDFGRTYGFLDRQVRRWLSELDSYSRFDGYPGPTIPNLERIAGWLEQHRPRSWRPGLMHGDYHVGNVLFSHTGPQVVAIVDWEMSTIGDPLLDLGWLIATWPGAGGPVDTIDSALARAGGLATRNELIERYAERGQRDVSAIDWYIVLACFKLGILLEGTYARACAGRAPMAVGEQLHESTLRLFERATTLAT